MDQFIDAKFKDRDPKETVEQIRAIFADLGVELKEKWNESNVENCYSVGVSPIKGLPHTNGKGVSPEFARASGYAEFIERIQAGIYLISYQSALRDPGMNLHTYAPDGKYMTVDELIANGDWMDHFIDSYKEQNVTRESLAEVCRACSCADDGRILTVPFYSLFEDQYVYLPIAFVGRMYSANGNCAGNTREEAWVHALSEMMERKASQKMLLSGTSAPRIPDEVLRKFPTVSNILDQVRADGNYDITVFDVSLGNGFPVVSTRIISKKNQNYHINVAADPVLEIAIQRTLTELFQGRGLDHMISQHDGRILNKITDYPVSSNVRNQLRSSDGMYTVDYFADELTCQREMADFPDNSNKSNKELLAYMLELYKQLGKPVYVRNYSYMGFHSYKFVVPGFSETNAFHLDAIIPEYALGDSVHDTFRNPTAASNEDLSWLLNYSETTNTQFSRYNTYSVNAGIPMTGAANATLCAMIRAYACYKLGKYAEAMQHTKYVMRWYTEEKDAFYFRCVRKYLSMKQSKIAEDKIRSILYKFFQKEYPDRLYEMLDQGLTPYEDYMIRCDLVSCSDCRYRESCCYHELRELTAKVGARYSQFVNGQDRSVFAVDC